MQLRKSFISYILLSCTVPVMGQTVENSLSGDSRINDTIQLSTINQIYDDSIKTVVLKAQNSPYSEPIVSIYPTSKLELSFDDLGNEYTEYHYEIIHCDKNWLAKDEEIRDFYDGNSTFIIQDNEFASATKVNYTHYKLVFPAEGERFLKSGNYVIRVYDYDSQVTSFVRRFMVVNPTVNISGYIVRTDDIRFSDYRQQVKFEIYDPKASLEDIGQIYVRVMKNASWDISCENVKPSFVNNNKITFERTDACTFDGGNEYRYFNMLEFKNLSNNIIKVEIKPGWSFSMWLDTDKARSYLNYSTITDFNGKSLYTSENKTFVPTELDYVEVHFTYKPDYLMLENEIFIYGELSGFQIDTAYKMIYDVERQLYTLTKMLKQGLYNYQYVIKSIYSANADESFAEGSHFETENDYTILVYYTNVFEGYDELLGIERINSRQKVDVLYKNK